MARLSQDFYDFSRDTFNTLGFGNPVISILFATAATLSLFGLAGFYFPALAESLSWLMTLCVGGGTFLGISLLGALTLPALVLGAIAGFLLASISTTLCAIALFLAPPAALLLTLPTVIAGISAVLGGICSVVEACFSRSDDHLEPQQRWEQQGYVQQQQQHQQHHQHYHRSVAPGLSAPRGDAFWERSPENGRRLDSEPPPPPYRPPGGM